MFLEVGFLFFIKLISLSHNYELMIFLQNRYMIFLQSWVYNVLKTEPIFFSKMSLWCFRCVQLMTFAQCSTTVQCSLFKSSNILMREGYLASWNLGFTTFDFFTLFQTSIYVFLDCCVQKVDRFFSVSVTIVIFPTTLKHFFSFCKA